MKILEGGRRALTGAQMLFVAFGALVLVPLLTGLDPNVALFTAGAGTLLFQLITKRSVPVFLASSFAFIPAITYGVKTWGIPATQCGLVSAGLGFAAFALAVRLGGRKLLDRLLPPIVTGPVITLIGLILAPVAMNMAVGRTGDGGATLMPPQQAITLAGLALGATLATAVFGNAFFRLIPILVGILTGYFMAWTTGAVNFAPVAAASWLGWPNFTLPQWNFEAVLFVLPFAIAPAVEHVGDIVAVGKVTGEDYTVEPGLHRTLLGDACASAFAAFVGGPPNITYAEVTGAVALTGARDPVVMTWAALCAIALAFCGKLGALLQTVPSPVMGGIMTLLFGNIAVIGLSLLAEVKQGLLLPRNMAIVGLMLITGLGSMALQLPGLSFKGVGAAAILGIVLNQLLPAGEGKSAKTRK